MPRRRPLDREQIERRDHVLRVKEEYPLPKIEGVIKDIDVLSTSIAFLHGAFKRDELEMILAHMKALERPTS